MATTYSLKGRDPTFVYDETHSIVGVANPNGSINRFSGKTYNSTGIVSVTSVASTFGASTYSGSTGWVLLTGTGAHGLTNAAIITALLTGVYVTWTGGIGVNGIYSVNSIAVDTTGNTLRIAYPYVSSVVTIGVGLAIITYPNHNRSVNDTFRFGTAGTLPTGMALNTTYFVRRVLSANTFTLSLSAGGAEVVVSNAGTGAHTAILWYGAATLGAATTAIPMASVIVDGNTFTPSGSLEVNALFGFTNSANAKRVQITYGGASNFLIDTGAGGYGGVASATMNKVAYARGANVICSSAATVGQGTSTGVPVSLTVAYNTDLPLVINTTMAVENEVTTLYAHQVEVS